MQKTFKSHIAAGLCLAFLLSAIGPMRPACAAPLLGLPEPGAMLSVSAAYAPAVIKGLTLDAKNPFAFNFIVDLGKSGLKADDPQLKAESTKLIKYFLAALTIPEKDLWVNLSPYEKDRLLPKNLAQTEMGRDMLAQDYLLKQLTASLIYPEKELGKAFWDKVYAKAQQLYGTTQVPVNTFNKVWIVADKADVFERGQTAFIVDAHLKVMLEEDYVALNKQTNSSLALSRSQDPSVSQIVREIILPEIEKEINEGKSFAPLRQMFYSMILATWFKKALKQGLVAQLYADQGKTKVGVNQENPALNEEIYERYLQAYKKGVFNYIKDPDPTNVGSGASSLPRKYFSGGLGLRADKAMQTVDAAFIKTGELHKSNYVVVNAELDQQEDAGSIINRALTYSYNQTVRKYGERFGWNHDNIYREGSCKYVTEFLFNYLSAQGFKAERVSYSGDEIEEYHYIIFVKLKDVIIIVDPTWQQFLLGSARAKKFPRALVVRVDSLRETLLGYGVEPTVIDTKYKALIENYYKHHTDTRFFYRKSMAQFFNVRRPKKRGVIRGKANVDVIVGKATKNRTKTGGIDLNADQMKMNIAKEGGGVGIKADPDVLTQIRHNGFEGFVPVIINIQPIKDVQLLLRIK